MELNLEGLGKDFSLDSMEDRALQAYDTLLGGEGPGHEFTGWIDLPIDYNKEEFARIKEAAKRIQEDSEVLLVVGIGGSYLGARAVIEALRPAFAKTQPEVLFTGNQLSGALVQELLDYLQDKKFSINVISKSGTTTETALAFRLFRKLLEDQVGEEEAAKRIYVTTDKEKGALKELADQQGYEEFVVPDEIGGRYSVLTAVGLLPIAAAGMDIDRLMEGAQAGRDKYLVRDFAKNPAMAYAASRMKLYEEEDQAIEILVSYEPKLRYFQEWWKQLAGESEGKDGKGLFPASVGNTTDLHSLGQWIQEGPKNHFETVLWFKAREADQLEVPEDEENLDGLNYMAGKTLYEVNQSAMLGTREAHIEGGVGNILLTFDPICEETLGEVIYFFEMAVGLTGHMMGVNPFNQPGVEFYKTNMYKLLGRPGY